MKHNIIYIRIFVVSRLLLIFLFLLSSKMLLAQNKLVESINQFAAIADTIQPQDTNKINNICEKLEKLINESGDSAINSEAYRILGTLYGKAGNFDKTFTVLEKAVETAPKNQNGSIFKSKALAALGMFFQQNGDFGMALDNYLEAEKLYYTNNNISELIGIYSSMGDLYDKILQPAKRKEINEKAFELSKLTNDTTAIIKATTGMATNLSNDGDFKDALKLYEKAVELSQKTGNKQLEHIAWYDIGFTYSRMDDYAKAGEMYAKSLEVARLTGNRMDIGDALYKMGLMSFYSEDFKKAEEQLFQAMEIALGIQSKILERNIYDVLYSLEEARGNYKKAYEYLNNYIDVEYAIFSEDDQRQVNFLKAKFDDEKREFVISKLEAEKEIQELKLNKQRWLIFGLLSILLFTVTMVLFIVKRYRYRQNLAEKQKQIQEQKILQLEKEKQLVATRSLLAGEETERTRLAGDLHDGLGGLLTGVKLKLSTMKENSIITSENLAHFNHALDLLDTSIAEMRRVAHNLMPETLMHYGLQTALSDFVKQMEPEGLPVLRINTFGPDIRYIKELEITVYRITQELVNNALKHAQASQVDIQLFTETERICVQVIDNGKGFDTGKPDKENNGKGLQSINDRITVFNGRFDLTSEPGKGTECLLEFFIS